MHTADGIDENSLRLTGNKIKLTARPVENQSRASSRCALLCKGYSRPLSAVPLLNLNYDEFDVSPSKRRPLSADFPATKVKDTTYRTNMPLSHDKYESHYIDGETSLESSEETDSNLPSSQLLHNLLSEPIYSWRNGIRSKPIRKSRTFKKSTPKLNKPKFGSSDSNETPSAESDTSSSNESSKVKPFKIQLSETNTSKIKTPTPSSTDRHSERSEENLCSKMKTPSSASPMSVTFYETVEVIPDSNQYFDDDCSGSITMDDVPLNFKSFEPKPIQPHSQSFDENLKNPKILITDESNELVDIKSFEDLTPCNEQPTNPLVERNYRPKTNSETKINYTNTAKSSIMQDSISNKELKDDAICGNSTMFLVPGLKTKPPLPRKPDISNLNSKINRKNSLQNLNDGAASKNNSNFEAITLDMLNYNLLTSQHDIKLSLGGDITSATNVKADSDAESEDNLPKETISQRSIKSDLINMEVNQTSTTTLSSDSDTIELKFQNWYQEEEKANNEILESEFITDLSLHKLKLENQKINENINKKDLSEKSQHENINKEILNRQLSSESRQLLVPKVVNFNDGNTLDSQNSKRNQNTYKRNANAKNFIKENINKLSTIPKRCPNSSNNNNLEISKGKGFVPTLMKSFRDYKEPDGNREVESWMSSNSEEYMICEENEELPNGNAHIKSPPYLKVLDEIDELQECCEELSGEEMPQQDKEYETTDQSDANTYDDIVSILQVLEEQDKKSHMKMESLKEIISNEIIAIENDNSKIPVVHSVRSPVSKSERLSPKVFKDDYANKENVMNACCNDCNRSSPHKSRERDQASRSSINSSTNLNDIFSYLDEVDRNCAKSLACAKERIQNTTQVLENNIKLDTIPKLEELLAYTNVELSHQIIDLSLRLKEKSSSIALLQKELSSLRNQITKLTKDTNETVKQRLKSQKEDYENVVKRHQKFIDQLIADKKTLNQQCEGLIHEMKVLEDRFNSNLKAAEHKHKVELQKVKEMHVAGEKLRRERWIDTKTQKIKELTVKGLEPELDKMAARHQQELNDLRALHKREIEDLELRSARKMQQQCEALREQLTAEREKAIAHEREVLRQRYEQLVTSEEHNYQEQRRRLLTEHANRISECEERENAAVIERDRAIKQVQNDFEDKLQAAIRRHNTELNVLKEKTELEMEAFRNNYKKQAATQIAEKEMQIREKCRKERDREIEAVIERLEVESNENKLQIEQSTENRIKRLKEKYEKEIKDLEFSESEATTKYSETKAKLLKTEDAIINLKATVKQMEIQLHDTQELSEKLSNERNKIKEVVREEMKQEIQTLEKEVHGLRNEKDKELQQVYARVKIAVARKEETISELSRDNAALQEKCAYLENMLEQQRKEYLIK